MNILQLFFDLVVLFAVAGFLVLGPIALVEKRKNTIKYLWKTTIHKYYVFKAGRMLKLSIWQLLLHDWHKYLPEEAVAYGDRFFGENKNPYAFDIAWLHHQNFGKHHWEYWIPRTTHVKSIGNVADRPLDMPDKYIAEMVSDWFAASRAYEGAWPKNFEEWLWWKKNFSKIRITTHTRGRAIVFATMLMDMLNPKPDTLTSKITI